LPTVIFNNHKSKRAVLRNLWSKKKKNSSKKDGKEKSQRRGEPGSTSRPLGKTRKKASSAKGEGGRDGERKSQRGMRRFKISEGEGRPRDLIAAKKRVAGEKEGKKLTVSKAFILGSKKKVWAHPAR